MPKTRSRSFAQASAELSGRLWARRPEIEQAALTRVYAVSDSAEAIDPEYGAGLRIAAAAALDYALAAVELGEERARPVPPALLAQARLAARSGVKLDTILRRYVAGYNLLADFLVEEIENDDLLPRAALRRLLRTQATLFDRLLTTISDEYAREADAGIQNTADERRAERVRRLLSGELLDTTELAYDFDAHHLGAIAKGPGAMAEMRTLAASLDRHLLATCHDEETVWVWLGGRRGLDPVEVLRLASSSWPSQITLAIGEPAQGLAGWRLTHQQARAALPIGLQGSGAFVRYADVALLASMLQDDVLSTSLRNQYLMPLGRERDGGEVARETLRAYFASERNVSSAAIMLGVNRHTVSNRLRMIEDRLCCSLSNRAAEMEAALRLHDAADAPPNHFDDTREGTGGAVRQPVERARSHDATLVGRKPLIE